MYYLFDDNWKEIERSSGYNPLAQRVYSLWEKPAIKGEANNWIHQVFDLDEGRRVGIICYLPDFY